MTKTPQAATVAANAPAGLDISEAEIVKQRAEGAKEAVKESAKDAYTLLVDGGLPDPAPNKWQGSDEIQMWAHIIDLGLDAFEERVASKGDDAIPEEKVYGLLALERNGKNRTPYVKAMMKRLKLKADELPGGGPAYTNDISNITDL